MKKILTTILSVAIALSAAAFTDDQVITYINQQTAAGKSEQQIGKELLAKGVTAEQVRRIKARLERANDKKAKTQSSSLEQGSATRRLKQGETSLNKNTLQNKKSLTSSTSSKKTSNALISDEDIDININLEGDLEDTKPGRQIYGHEIFNQQALTFEPNANIATPKNYRLGPGDEVIIDIWGAAEDHIRKTITPEGSIMVQQLGPIHLNGMTVDEANRHIRKLFASKYAGVGSDKTDIGLTLGDIRSIQIDIMGEVERPGSFRMSPFSNVFHALYNAGGINNIGSMRDIKVLRNGKRVATVDIYDYLFNGKQTGNIRLQEGDVIIVPPYSQLVELNGNVKRPMYYELKPGETIDRLISLAGGFSGDAYSDVLRIERQNGTENELVTIDRSQYKNYKLQDGDIVTVGTVIDRYANRVESKGALNRPGQYALGKGISTLKDLINKSEGLTEDAFLNRALIYREGPNLELEVIAVNLSDLLNGHTPDIELKRNDILEVSSVLTLNERGDVQINGLVTNPGKYPFADNMTLADLILQAGGLLEGASTAHIDVSRRITNPTDSNSTARIADIYQLKFDNSYKTSDRAFKLKPYDIVEVHPSPDYHTQEQVEIKGEAMYIGKYTLSKRNERLSDIIKRAGGLKESAYIPGASLVRKMTEEEILVRDQTIKMAKQNSNETDSLDVEKIDLSDTYNVGIDLAAALANPGTPADVVLQEGDVLNIPQMQSTVKISGDVLFPNTVGFVPGKKAKYYIEQAGGYGNRAEKKKAFVVYMNGSVAKIGRNTKLEPGSHIVVPTKEKTTGFDWAKLTVLTGTLGTVATMAATVIAIFR